MPPSIMSIKYYCLSAIKHRLNTAFQALGEGGAAFFVTCPKSTSTPAATARMLLPPEKGHSLQSMGERFQTRLISCVWSCKTKSSCKTRTMLFKLTTSPSRQQLKVSNQNVPSARFRSGQHLARLAWILKTGDGSCGMVV